MKLTTAQAIVKYLIAQRTVIDGVDVPLFPGVYAIFGHGNVTCLGHALEEEREALPTWRGQNEQGMALAAVGYAKAKRRRQIMVATSSIGPGATNMVTAAGVAHVEPPARCCSSPARRSRAGSPIRCCSRSSTSATRRSPSTTRFKSGHPLLGPHHAARAGGALAAARGGHDARPGHVRPGVPRPPAGRAGRVVRLPRPLLRRRRARGAAAPGRPRSARGAPPTRSARPSGR